MTTIHLLYSGNAKFAKTQLDPLVAELTSPVRGHKYRGLKDRNAAENKKRPESEALEPDLYMPLPDGMDRGDVVIAKGKELLEDLGIVGVVRKKASV